MGDNMESQLQPSAVLCEELESVQRAEEAWLHGQEAALKQRSVMTSDLGAISNTDGAAQFKVCGKSCRACRRKHGSWSCDKGRICRCDFKVNSSAIFVQSSANLP